MYVCVCGRCLLGFFFSSSHSYFVFCRCKGFIFGLFVVLYLGVVCLYVCVCVCGRCSLGFFSLFSTFLGLDVYGILSKFILEMCSVFHV